LVALSAAYWVLKSLQGQSVSATAVVASANQAAVDPQALARALGGRQASVPVAPGGMPTSERVPYALVGVLADRTRGGAALISVDGKPAKPFAIGAVVDGGLVLQSVQGRTAVLSEGTQGGASIRLDMPALSK
jgi:general secretion pathway protein C